MRHTHTKESLAPLVATSQSFRDIVKKLGLNYRSGGNNAYIKRLVLKFKLDTSHFAGGVRDGLKKGGWNKGVPNDAQRRGAVERLVLGSPEDYRIPANILRRCLIEIGREYVCGTCGLLPVWNGKPLVLQGDHINGAYWDNREENLRFICPNCHSQTENYGSKNGGIEQRWLT